MKISLITVCYNAEKTIEETMRSVLSQTEKNYEYIIVDGKSRDNTLSIVKSYEKLFGNKLKWISEKDNGIYDAMNKGIKLATGDIIGILNADDILAHENVFHQVIENIKNNDGVYSNLLMLDQNMIKPYRLFKYKKNQNKKNGWHPPHPTLYLKKEIYKKYGNFNLNYKIAADLDFMLRIMNQKVKLKYVNDYFVFMRSGGESTAGLKGYTKNFLESYKVLKNNKVKFSLLINITRIFKTFCQRINALNRKEIIKAFNCSHKKKLIQLNTVTNASTGKIMRDIQKKANEEGYQTISFYGRRKGYSDLRCEKFGNSFSFWIHVGITTLFDKQGYGSYFCTKKLVKRLKEENSDIIHLHNLHGYYLHIPTLFNYLTHEYKGKIYWTFHDCWPFTGHCPYFINAKCDKWKTGCYCCPNKKEYPISLLKDNSKENYIEKKKMFTSLNNLTIITPSEWLQKLVEQSFFKDKKIITIHNGIDLEKFRPIEDKKILSKYHIPQNKKIILGVANIWEERKGLATFFELSKELPEEYIIVLVGLKKNQIKKLNSNMYGIERTEDQNELVKLYSVANVFVNPSKEETFSLVTIEALACHTPIIVLENTPMENFVNKDNGIVCKEKIKIEDIEKIVKKKKYNFNDVKKYDKKLFCEKIIKLYKEGTK